MVIQRVCHASAFVSGDRNEARTLQRFIHVTLVHNFKEINQTDLFKSLNLQ